MAGHELAYIALASRDVALTCEVLGNDLELPSHTVSSPSGSSHPAFAVGRTALVVFEAGDPFLSRDGPGVDHIALAADSPSDTVAGFGLPGTMADGDGLNGTRQSALQRTATCGVDTRFCQPLGLSAPAGKLIERVDHIGIASADNVGAEAVFVGQIGCVYESRQTDMEVAQAIESFTSDKYGVIYHTRPPTPVGGLRVSFITTGDCELEFLHNFDPTQGFAIKHGTAGNTKQDQSAIGRFVEKRGPGLHHIALKCHDIDALLPRLADNGRRMIDLKGRPGSRRSRIGFVHPAGFGGILMHFVERQDLST